jgi:uncharacterized circularly permuted ATP-grasp superfamily protein
MHAVLDHGVARLAEQVRGAISRAGVAFSSVDGDEDFVVDPHPRVIESGEWEVLEAGVAQRTRALDAFVEDVYGRSSAVAEGAIPARVVESADYLDPGASELRPPRGTWIGVAGLDVVRGADGCLKVLEDNVRTPSGFAYIMAARVAVLESLPAKRTSRPRPVDVAPGLLHATLRAAAPVEAGDDPLVVVLSDGPSNSAWWEHRVLAERMGVPLVRREQLEVRRGRLWRHDDDGRPVDVVYRRTNDCTMRSWVGQLLGPPIAAGTLGVVNGFGTGVADDKLVHAYVEELIRFFLGEQPILPSVPTYDLQRPEHLEEVLDRLGELVVKPRNGSGGEGVRICARESDDEVAELRDELAAHPEGFVAQDLVMLSTHPTAIDGELEPRHVDLRPFVFLDDERRATVLPGGLTRVALDAGALVVNSSRNGGAKDTWVLP